MPSTNYAYVNGHFVPETEARISIYDRGFLYGDGVFETMRVYGGKIFRLAEHLARLVDGLRELRISSPLSDEELHAVCQALISRNGVIDGFARIYLTRGVGEIGLPVGLVTLRTTIVQAQTRQFRPQEILRAKISSHRVDADSSLTRVKSANRLPYVLARLEAAQTGLEEAVLLNHRGQVAEFTASNLFAVQNGHLYTPPLEDGALPGITRQAVLTIAAELNIRVHETSIVPTFLDSADEIFATNSLQEIASVTKLEGLDLPEPRIAPRLHEAYRQLVREELQLT